MKSRLLGAVIASICLLGFVSTVSAVSFQPLGDAYSGTLSSSSGWAISGDGTTVVGNLTSVGGRKAFRWQLGSSVSTLSFSNATDVSYDGSVIVGERYRWTQTTGAQDIGELGSGGATAYGVSADGSAVVGFSDGPNGREAYRWTQSGGM